MWIIQIIISTTYDDSKSFISVKTCDLYRSATLQDLETKFYQRYQDFDCLLSPIRRLSKL